MTERGTIYQTTKARGGEGSQKKSHKDRYKEIRGTITAKQKKNIYTTLYALLRRHSMLV